MKNFMNSVELQKPSSNIFDLTHDVKMTGKMGNLMPVMAIEAVPGDYFKLGADTLVRFAPMVAPVMHRYNATIHYFFVPNRILWNNWEDFITGKTTGGAPYFEMNNSLSPEQEKLLDYLGIPPFSSGGGTAVNINALPLAAYQNIYNEYYRYQNLVSEVNYKLTDGNNTSNSDLVTMRRRAFEHDYFTSCLPTTQAGADVDIPLGDVVLNPDWFADGQDPVFRNSILTTPVGALETAAVAGNPIRNVGATDDLAYDPDGSLTTSPTTIKDLRIAVTLQKWFERLLLGGRRYKETIKAMFGVNSSDARLQRPEYITGVKTPITISEVQNTSGSFDPTNPSDPSSPVQGSLAGNAISVGSGNVGSHYCEEHGWIIGIMSVMPKTSYQQGIKRSFLMREVEEYLWPQFAHLSERPVLNDEIYAYDAAGAETFGYLPMYSEYRTELSRSAGDFRTSLSYWTGTRIFASLPNLNQQFIECDPDEQDRIFAVQDGTDYLWMQVLNMVTVNRQLPVYGTPLL